MSTHKAHKARKGLRAQGVKVHRWAGVPAQAVRVRRVPSAVADPSGVRHCPALRRLPSGPGCQIWPVAAPHGCTVTAAAFVASRQTPPSPVMWPSFRSVQRWLGPPWQAYRVGSVPGAVLLCGRSAQLPDAESTRRASAGRGAARPVRVSSAALDQGPLPPASVRARRRR